MFEISERHCDFPLLHYQIREKSFEHIGVCNVLILYISSHIIYKFISAVVRTKHQKFGA